MDQLLRSKELCANILARSASLHADIQTVQDRLKNLSSTDLSCASAALAAGSRACSEAGCSTDTHTTGLLDLPPDALRCICVQAGHALTACCLARSCKALCTFVHEDDQLWQQLCQSCWGVKDKDRAWHMLTGSASDMARQQQGSCSNGNQSPNSPGTGAEDTLRWRLLHRTLTEGWREVQQMLTWLRSHEHPAGVSGARHRAQLLLALRCIACCTQTQHQQPLAEQVVELGGVRSCVALLAAETLLVRDLALEVRAS